MSEQDDIGLWEMVRPASRGPWGSMELLTVTDRAEMERLVAAGWEVSKVAYRDALNGWSAAIDALADEISKMDRFCPANDITRPNVRESDVVRALINLRIRFCFTRDFLAAPSLPEPRPDGR